jgi:hypothetical protein
MDTTQADVMRNFITSYISQPKFDNLSVEEKSAMLQTLLQNFDDRLNLLIVNYCPDDKKAELTTLIKEGNEAKINTFFDINMPNLSQLIEMETKEFINDLVC